MNKEIVFYRTAQFERCIADMRAKGGTAADAAGRIDVILGNILKPDEPQLREKFRFTRNGEHRIKYCRKIALGCGYRLVFIQKDDICILLYAGAHDDCFRWIERNKGLSYEVDRVSREIRAVPDVREDTDMLPDDVLQEKEFSMRYEDEIMKALDDKVLARIFSGLCGGPPRT